MSRISIVDLEVFYRVGVPDEERAQPQRLLLTIDLDFDFSAAAHSDRIEDTINYKAITDDLLKFGEGRSWKLIEKLAADVADLILKTYRPHSVQVEVKKFIIPQARYVAVALAKPRVITHPAR
jgi:FolB domain-containing protein